MNQCWDWQIQLILRNVLANQYKTRLINDSGLFAAFVIRARLRQLDRSLEDAATDLGAGTWHTMWHITVPQLRPALAASALLTFTLSLDDFVITFFTAGPAAQLLPVRVFSMVRLSSTPAASS